MHTPATRASAQKREKKRTLRRSPRWENRTDLGLTVRTERREALQGNLRGPAPAGRRPDGGLAAGFLRRSRPRSPTPRAESENEKGRREKRRCLVNSVSLGPTGRSGCAKSRGCVARLPPRGHMSLSGQRATHKLPSPCCIVYRVFKTDSCNTATLACNPK